LFMPSNNKSWMALSSMGANNLFISANSIFSLSRPQRILHKKFAKHEACIEGIGFMLGDKLAQKANDRTLLNEIRIQLGFQNSLPTVLYAPS